MSFIMFFLLRPTCILSANSLKNDRSFDHRLLSLPMIHSAQLSPDVRYRYESIAREISVTSFHHHPWKKETVNKKATYISFVRSPRSRLPPAVLLSFAEIYEQIRYIAGYYSLDAMKKI